jgi:hypothetical protein
MFTDEEEYDGDRKVPLDPKRMAHLRTLHTRKLISLLRGTYGRSKWWENWEAAHYDEPTTAEIKAVLQTREHILNKVESEEIRKEQAKTRKEARNNRYVMRRR